MHAHNSAFSISTESGTARELGALAMQAATPVVPPLWREPTQRGFGLPRPFPSHCVCWWVLSATSAALNLGHPSTWGWASQVCWKQQWIPCLWQAACLSHKCHSQRDTQRHRETPRVQKYQNNNLCSKHWTPITFLLQLTSSLLTEIILRHFQGISLALFVQANI